MKQITVLVLNEEDYKRKTAMDYLLFFFSAAIISGVIIGFFYTNLYKWTMVAGYFMALFWLLTSWGYRGLLKGYIEHIANLEKVIQEDIDNRSK